MAKELPYFKFETSEWDNGTIQMCSREAKGLFIDLCSIYWSRLGDLPYALALQKHCNGNAQLLQELETHQIIIVKDAKIIIDFLEEQLEEFQETREKRRNAANKRWSDASAMQVHSKSNATRQDETREEKIRKDNKIPSKDLFISHALEKKPNLDRESIGLKYDAWMDNDWKDGNDKPIKNWKSKLNNTIPYLRVKQKNKIVL